MNLIFVNFILNLDRNSVFPCLELVVVDTKTIFERRILESCNKAHIFHFPGGSREDILVDIEYYLPKGSPEFSAVEECWKQGKDDLLVSKYYPSFTNLKAAITDYYRTKRFKLDITKYLMRESANLC